MAAVNRRSRVLEGECLESMMECFEEAYASQPQRYKNTTCTACFGPLLAPVAVVERATWEAQFHDIVKKCREPSLEAWDREYPSVKYCERGDSEKPGVGRLVRGYVFLTMRAMELQFQLIQQAGTWGFPEPAMRPGSGQQGHINYYPETARRYQHPALTKAVAGFVTYGDHAACMERQAKARAKRAAQQGRRALEHDYLAKRNERLRMLVVPGGRERLATNGNYFPSRDPMFNGQDKAVGVKIAMDLSEVPPPARGVYDYDAWVTDFLGQFRKPGKRRRR
eukprot:jgi/Tetstr1/441482/TSEL_003125.t1